ncbi:MAG: tRNA lysidine(34) synthetase TilS [Candidatus Moraniibacteriota bacterium]
MNKDNFIKKIQNFIFRKELFNRGDKILAGISGGPDSTCLALVLSELAKKYDLKLRFVHINYRQRGEESDKDEEFVRKLAKDLDIPLDVIQFNKKNTKGNLEELLRNFRYREFERIRKSEEFDRVAVGHTLDDKVETFLMNLLRGSGIKGLISLKSKRGSIIRPLLGFEKKEVEAFLEKRKIKPRLDKSNLDTKFLRNRVRLELIPLIERNYNSSFKYRAEKLIENLEDEDELAEMFIENIYSDIVKIKRKKGIVDVEKISDLPIGGWKRIFRMALLDIKGDLRNVSANHFLEFKKIALSEKSKKQKIHLSDFSLERKKNRVIIRLESL